MSAVLLLRLEGQTSASVDLAKSSNAELRQLAGRLYAEVAQIEVHLAHGGSLDWEERARKALGVKKGQLAAIEREQARRQERAERSTTEHQFLAVARERLPKGLFEQLLSVAETAARKTRLQRP